MIMIINNNNNYNYNNNDGVGMCGKWSLTKMMVCLLDLIYLKTSIIHYYFTTAKVDKNWNSTLLCKLYQCLTQSNILDFPV